MPKSARNLHDLGRLPGLIWQRFCREISFVVAYGRAWSEPGPRQLFTRPRGPLAGASVRMERQWSLEDYNIANSMWKLGAGFPRTDSENAFQDFLKRIPSTTNLAAQAGQHLDQQQQAQLHQQVQHLHQQSQQQQAAYPSGAGIPGNAGDMQPGAGIPRVPSLDFLRQLVGHQFNPAQFSPSPAVVPKQGELSDTHWSQASCNNQNFSQLTIQACYRSATA